MGWGRRRKESEIDCWKEKRYKVGMIVKGDGKPNGIEWNLSVGTYISKYGGAGALLQLVGSSQASKLGRNLLGLGCLGT